MEGAPKVKSIRLYLGIRILLFFSVLLWSVSFHKVLGPESLKAIYGLTFFSFIINYIFSFSFESLKGVRYFLATQVLYDIFYATALSYYTGGAESGFVFLYPVIIIYAAILMGRAAAILSAAVSALTFYMVKVLMAGSPLIALDSKLFQYSMSFLLTGILAAFLMDEIRKNRSLLEESEKNLISLNRFNHLVLGNMDSGLILRKGTGSVRTVNEKCVKWIGARNSREACLWLEHHWKTLGLNDISERDFSKKLHQIKFPRANIEGHVIRASFFDSKETPVDIYFIHDMSSYLNLRRETELNKRLASVGRLAAGIAHELRNPLAGISGSAQVLAKELSVKKNREDNEYSERLSEIIVSESDRMNRLIKDFLSFSKSSDARRTKVDLAQLIDQVFDQLRSQEDLPKDLSFHDIESESVWIYANEDHVKQILLNLYLNSIEALREKQGSKDIWTHVREDSEVVVLEIRDNGPGIPKEKQDRIFEPFFSTKESGTGLGLATVFQLMESNGGEISYNSSSHPSGACFILKFEEYKNEMASEVA